jgi:hypothetical protein
MSVYKLDSRSTQLEAIATVSIIWVEPRGIISLCEIVASSMKRVRRVTFSKGTRRQAKSPKLNSISCLGSRLGLRANPKTPKSENPETAAKAGAFALDFG